jgi:hypothetical protein
MAPMNCEEFWRLSSDWLEGERNPSAASHISSCAPCRALIADLEAIRGAATLLSEVEPPAHLWSSIRSQLERENLIRSPRQSRRFSWLEFPAFRPALAAAYLALIIAAAVVFGITGVPMNSNSVAEQQAIWLQHAQSTMTPVAAELSSAETKALPALQGSGNDVTATLNHNLAIVDNMISMCEKSVREDPQNEMTRDYLYTAYQQKADLLATMTETAER